jgi:hypothetical protein
MAEMGAHRITTLQNLLFGGKERKWKGQTNRGLKYLGLTGNGAWTRIHGSFTEQAIVQAPKDFPFTNIHMA